MGCERCRDPMIQAWARSIEDHDPPFRMAAWHCQRCGYAIEEIVTVAGLEPGQAHRIRYAVQVRSVACRVTQTP